MEYLSTPAELPKVMLPPGYEETIARLEKQFPPESPISPREQAELVTLFLLRKIPTKGKR